MSKLKLALTMALVLTGCSTITLSENQRTLAQTRIFPGATIDDVYQHMKTTLNENHYAIKSSDLLAGIIVASKPLPRQGGAFERREEIVINLDTAANGIRTQVSIQTIIHYSLGGTFGHEVQTRAPYEQFFSQADKGRDDNRVPASVRLK